MAFMGPGFDVDLHRPEFENHETLSAVADALLPEEDRTWGSELNPERYDQHDWQPQRQADQNAGAVENSFPGRDRRSGCRCHTVVKLLLLNRSAFGKGVFNALANW